MKNMKKLLAIVLALAMVLCLAACGGGTTESTTADGGDTTTAAGDGSTLRLINGKIEVDAQLKELAAKYKEETGVTVEIESMGGGVDIQSTIKGYYQAGNMPDMFVCNSGDFANWEGLLADLSNESWVADTDAAWADANGAVYGFPYTTEAIGLAYNADILEKAGIDPATLTTPAAMQAAFETIDGMKADLGLTAVIGYCAEPSALYWSTGDHLFGTYIDAGTARDDTTYIDLLNDGGKLDEARFANFANMVALFNQYSDPDLLVSGTYDQQVLNFASGKYAFVTQGSWIGATMTNDDAEAYAAAGSFKVGMAPYAFEDGIDTIMTNSPSWWAVYDGDNADAAKAFLTWCASEAGQEILVKQAGFVSPFKSCTFVADDPFAQTIADYVAAGKTSPWHWMDKKQGIAQNYLGQVFTDFASGKITSAADFVTAMVQVCQSAYAG